MAKDYYTILGVARNAPQEEIKKAFRKLAHQFHPDKEGGDEIKFKEISEAYSVLSDDKRRAEYDSYGRVFGDKEAGGSNGFSGFDFNAAGFDPQDFQNIDFEDIFGGLGNIFSGGRDRARRGRDISIDLELSFQEAVFGTERKVLLTKISACSTCNATGAAPGSKLDTCATCNGKGNVHETKRSVLGTFTSSRICDVCHGKGQIPSEKCSDCKGLGVARAEEEIIITVPPNIHDGEMIRMSGAGEAVAGGIPGDLYIKLHVTTDPRFRREGTVLYTDLQIKLSDALLGSEYSVPTLDGNIKVKVPAGASPGEILRVKGKGVPIDGSRRGDLFITLNVKLPQKLSRNARKIIEELKKEGI